MGDAEAFNQEWQEKTRTAFRGLDYNANRRTDRRELPDERGRYERAPRDHRERRDRREDGRERRREEQLALPAPAKPTGRDRS